VTCLLTVHCFHCSLSVVLIQMSSHDVPLFSVSLETIPLGDTCQPQVSLSQSLFCSEVCCVAHGLTTLSFLDCDLMTQCLRCCKWNQTKLGVDKQQLCLQTLILRDWWLCMVISVMFEVVEYTLEHQLPNFSECWWDHVSIDSLCCFLVISISLH